MQGSPTAKQPPGNSGKLVALILVLTAVVGAVVARQYRVSHAPPTVPATQSTTDEAY